MGIKRTGLALMMLTALGSCTSGLSDESIKLIDAFGFIFWRVEEGIDVGRGTKPSVWRRTVKSHGIEYQAEIHREDGFETLAVTGTSPERCVLQYSITNVRPIESQKLTVRFDFNKWKRFEVLPPNRLILEGRAVACMQEGECQDKMQTSIPIETKESNPLERASRAVEVVRKLCPGLPN